MQVNTFIKFCIALNFIALCGCLENNFSYLYNTYKGTCTLKEAVSGNGQSEITSTKDITVRIDRRSILINEDRLSYRISEDTDGFVMIDTEKTGSDSSASPRFRYLKDSGMLVMIEKDRTTNLMTEEMMNRSKLRSFAPFTLTADIGHLSSSDKEVIGILFRVADIMDEIFWEQAYGNADELMNTTRDSVLTALFSINYGPWERLNDNKPFLPGYGIKPPGANFYPADITREEFEQWTDSTKTSQYTLIRRDRDGKLIAVPYHVAFSDNVTLAARLLREAAGLASDPGFKEYLLKRADAFETDNYYPSDTAWMKMKDNSIDFIAGPIENYEDALYNYKSAHEAFILIKDTEWSNRLKHIASFLPALQRGLPVPDSYKTSVPSGNSEICVYDAIYYRGDCNAGSKTIAINLPNDPNVRKDFGSRKLQLKNSIRAKFENILIPVSNLLVTENQRQYIEFDAFFSNTMFHETAHGLGVDFTVNGKGPVREALKEHYSAMEECKADIMGLYIASKLNQMGETANGSLMTNYVTFMAGTFRSVRFGAASAHGIANMITFNYLSEHGAFIRDSELSTYSVDFKKMNQAVISLMQEVLAIQANGDYESAASMISEYGRIRNQLQEDLTRLNSFDIPVDIVFEQGLEKIRF